MNELEAESQELRAPTLRSVCAWCTPGVKDENTTHGICDMHAEAMLAELHREQAAKQNFSPKENQQP